MSWVDLQALAQNYSGEKTLFLPFLTVYEPRQQARTQA
jgi:hypothetical protein